MREPEYAENLLREISGKAQGVFLWVHLVVSSLLSGLANGDRMRDLQRRLDDLPPRLEDLFEKILYGLEQSYLTHASQLFQLGTPSWREVGKCSASFATIQASFQAGQTYPLVNSAILDSGSTIHIFNNIKRFKRLPHPAREGDCI